LGPAARGSRPKKNGGEIAAAQKIDLTMGVLQINHIAGPDRFIHQEDEPHLRFKFSRITNAGSPNLILFISI
jgi:hypothetical protein